MDGYGPLADHWAARGFVVIQPTHLDSATLGLGPDDPRTPRIWRYRIEDLVRVLDELDRIEAVVPGLAGRLDRDQIAVAGHSWGATTASALLGARVLGDDAVDADARVTAGVLLAVAGTGGADLTPFAAEHFPFMNPSFAELTTPTLVVAGDRDQSLLSVRGPDWWTDAFRQSPGADGLLTLFGAEHSLGGIHTYMAEREMGDSESPELVALVQRVTTAYLDRALGRDDRDWSQALDDDLDQLGWLEST
jgi:pimeloyl-ACP methyl ester carboxylesterase